MLLLPALIVLRTSPEAWTDMAGALTYRGMNHVWQGCPANGGWHGSASADGVRWQDRGITVIAVNESWEGYTSHSGTNGSPCAGFATVDDDGTPCVGFRPCSCSTGTTALNPRAHNWDAPLQIRCATNANLTRWSQPEYLFPVYFSRPLPYDPPAPWKDHDGRWYQLLSTDGCNSSLTDGACPAGGRMDMWSSPSLHGPAANWTYVGPMLTTTAYPVPAGGGSESGHGGCVGQCREFVTSGFFGSVFGDPRNGLTRVLTHGNDAYYLGVQANGSAFVDTTGGNKFSAEGEMGIFDWGSYAPTNVTNATGVAALQYAHDLPNGAKQWGGLFLCKTLGSDPNQVAVTGRRTLVSDIMSGGGKAYTGEVLHSVQSLLQELTLGTSASGAVVLQQQFVSELASLRQSSPVDNSSHQFEVVASITRPADGDDTDASFTVLGGTKIGVDFARRLVFVDARDQKNPAVRAGPLFGNSSTVHVHVIVDHSIVAAIFANRTSITARVQPAVTDGGVAAGPGVVIKGAWQLATANENSHLSGSHAPKIHNAPACLDCQAGGMKDGVCTK